MNYLSCDQPSRPGRRNGFRSRPSDPPSHFRRQDLQVDRYSTRPLEVFNPEEEILPEEDPVSNYHGHERNHKSAGQLRRRSRCSIRMIRRGGTFDRGRPRYFAIHGSECSVLSGPKPVSTLSQIVCVGVAFLQTCPIPRRRKATSTIPCERIITNLG